MSLDDLIFIDNLPKLDLHGLDRDTALVIINEFINDNIIMKNEFLIIIHGIGTNTLKNKTHEVLESNKNVIEYKLSMYNIGCTFVKIKI